MRINDYFDKIICINLSKRPDRWKDAQAQFHKNGITVERFDAIEGNPRRWAHVKDRIEGKDPGDVNYIKPESFGGVAGCIASHTDIWKMAKEKGWGNVLIIEDDCDFIENFITLFAERVKQIPADWDMIYLGGVHETRGGQFIPQKFSEHVLKCARTITTTCYAIKSSVYDLALNIVFEEVPWFHTAIDGYLGAYVQGKCKAYCFHPPLVWQRGSHSNIQNQYRDYSDWMKNDNIR